MNNTKVVIYARVSPKGRKAGKTGQEAAAESLESQFEIIRDYCDRQGYEVQSEWFDEFASGDDEDRPGMWGAIGAVKTGEKLLIWRYDRLARSVFLQESIRRELERRKVRIEAVEGHNGDTPEDDLVRGILAHVAEYEKRLNAARTKAHMLQRQQSGQLISRYPPMGMRIIDGNRLAPCKEEIRLLTLMLKLRNAGISYRQIAQRLNHQGERFRGKLFRHQTVSRGLRRWALGGIPIPPPPQPLRDLEESPDPPE